MLRHVLNLVYLFSCVSLGLFILDLCDLCLIFSLISIVINHIRASNRHTNFLSIFQIIFYFFWMIMRMKKVNNFQIAKVQPRHVAQFCFIFCQFQPDVAYKSVAYKKRVYNDKIDVIKFFSKPLRQFVNSCDRCGC